jgi:hypothetical protein
LNNFNLTQSYSPNLNYNNELNKQNSITNIDNTNTNTNTITKVKNYTLMNWDGNANA